MRRPPSIRPPQAFAAAAPAVLRPSRPLLLEVDLAVVTPLFGGGAEPGKPDMTFPVRPTAVRGHLRFWWRACRATDPRFDTAKTLFAEEARIWGQAHRKGDETGPSPIEVEVEPIEPEAVREQPCRVWGRYLDRNNQPQQGQLWDIDRAEDEDTRYDPLGYALFPFQETVRAGIRIPPAPMLRNVRFRLRLFEGRHTTGASVGELRRAAESAIWAWVTFGGIGARTRRGCGTLAVTAPEGRYQPKGLGPGDSVAPPWKKIGSCAIAVDGHIAGGSRRLPLPVLAGARLLVGPTRANAVAAWRDGVTLLRDFRQGVGVGRNQKGDNDDRPGTSRWPEADSIRLISRDPDYSAHPEFQRVSKKGPGVVGCRAWPANPTRPT